MNLRGAIWCSVSSTAQAADDKESMPGQEADARAWAERNSVEIVDIFKVPGFSRYYDDFDECMEEMAAEGIDAFARLRTSWEKKPRPWDILIVRDPERLARTLPMLAFIIRRLIKSGIRLYFLIGGEVNANNYLTISMIGGYKAEAHIDFLVQARSRAMDTRARQGLPTANRVVSSHTLIRDVRTGRALRLVVNEALRPMWEAMADALLTGIPWNQMGVAMAAKGFVKPTGEPYTFMYPYKTLHTPAFWGHSARHYTVKGARNEPWTYEEGHPVPPGVEVYYNTHEAVWPPGTRRANEVIAELNRRHSLAGHASPLNTSRYTNVFLCADCGYTMKIIRRPRKDGRYYYAIFCGTRWMPDYANACPNTKITNHQYVQKWITARLKQAIAANDPAVFFPDEKSNSADVAQLEAYLRQIQVTEALLSGLIADRATAELAIRDIYAQRIDQETQKLKFLRGEVARLESVEVQLKTRADQMAILKDIAEISLEVFWQLDDRTINQTLLRLLGRRRLVVRGSQVIGTADAPKRGIKRGIRPHKK